MLATNFFYKTHVIIPSFQGRPFCMDVKLDGERMLCHREGSKVRLALRLFFLCVFFFFFFCVCVCVCFLSLFFWHHHAEKTSFGCRVISHRLNKRVSHIAVGVCL